MKYEWKKRDKALYLPKSVPGLVTVPAFSFFMLKGKGNPNDEAFAEAVGVLHALSYAVKMSPREGKELSYLDKNELVQTRERPRRIS